VFPAGPWVNRASRGYAKRMDERRHRHDDETEEEREEDAAELAEEIAEENPDPITRREAIEQGLEEEGLSEEGGRIGEHND
jgi:hypothetical protein